MGARVFWQPGSITNVLNCHDINFFLFLLFLFF